MFKGEAAGKVPGPASVQVPGPCLVNPPVALPVPSDRLVMMLLAVLVPSRMKVVARVVAPPCEIAEITSAAFGFVELLTRLKIPAVLEGSITYIGTKNVSVFVTGAFILIAPL